MDYTLDGGLRIGEVLALRVRHILTREQVALRYQLGDAGASRPRYAPVLLDEALINADAHFTKRAIGAWRGLGFQLIIGAPNDKYSAIEPHVDVEYDILKDTRGRSWAKPKVAL